LVRLRIFTITTFWAAGIVPVSPQNPPGGGDDGGGEDGVWPLPLRTTISQSE
jgi:hypothetical protein